MDFLNYISEYKQMNVLPKDRASVDQELLSIPVPTKKLDTKRALPSKQVGDEIPEYKVYWGSMAWIPPVERNSVKENYKRFVDSWEGKKLTKVDGDRGGLTNNGITMGAWKSFGKDKNGDGKIDESDLALISRKDHSDILEQRFWNAARADEIINPFLAAYVVDWTWGSGPGAFKHMHKAFGLAPQSKMSQQLLDRLNSDASYAYITLNNARKKFYKNIVAKDPSQKKFLKGWLRRADAIDLNGMRFNK